MANKLQPISPQQLAQLARMGRNGDTMIAHINPREAAMLKRMGGSGKINPATGLIEYAFGDDSWGFVNRDGGDGGFEYEYDFGGDFGGGSDYYDYGGGMYGDLGSGFNNVNDPYGQNDGSIYTPVDT